MNDIELWRYLFSHDTHNKTVEFTMGGQRMVFTVDPENLRAILATQFGDYGKGEPFHEGSIRFHLVESSHKLIWERVEGVPGRFHIHD